MRSTQSTISIAASHTQALRKFLRKAAVKNYLGRKTKRPETTHFRKSQSGCTIFISDKNVQINSLSG
jgi:hypothetical protein